MKAVRNTTGVRGGGSNSSNSNYNQRLASSTSSLDRGSQSATASGSGTDAAVAAAAATTTTAIGRRASSAASRNKVNSSVSPPKTIEIRGISVHFPFQPYECQERYMEKVIDALNSKENALLESPTGTGKTLCLLCSCLAWQRQQACLPVAAATSINTITSNTISSTATEARSTTAAATATKSTSRVPTIIYASRTHSQLSQVVRELRNTRYRPKHAVLGSREQMCVHPKVKKPTATASTINHDCSALNKERKCQFKNRLDGFTPPSTDPTTGEWNNTQPVMDMEDLVSMGHSHKVCPFYYTRGLVEDAELILVPYNYLFDKDSRSTTLADVPWDNAIVIFDEAHNLEGFASESASFDLTTKDIGGAMMEIDRVLTYLEADPDRFGHIKRDHLIKLKSILMKFEQYILNLTNYKEQYEGAAMMEFFQQGAGINYVNHNFLLAEIRKIMEVFLELRGGNSKGAPYLEHFVGCVKRVFGENSEAKCIAKSESYRVHVTKMAPGGHIGGKDGAVRTLSYWCFAPSEAMRELADLNVRSFLITSGTLSPLESYALELDIPFPHRLENPHIIDDDQIHVRVMGRGVKNVELSSSYERRQQDDYYDELGHTLASLSRTVPGGMLVFFPSYGVMETALEKWGGPTSSRNNFGKGQGGASNFFATRKKPNKVDGNRYSFPHQPMGQNMPTTTKPTPWKRLLSNKAVIIEPKSSSDLPDAIEEFHKFLNLPKSTGVTLFGVCRGKISEGIDFAHDMCRAVIITGLPFAPSFDPKVKMKREFLDDIRRRQAELANLASKTKDSDKAGFSTWGENNGRASLSGHEWYAQQAHRAVNQAVGRVIRNKRDYGAVILMDSRFSMPGNQNGLSKWVRPHIKPDEGFGRANRDLVQFYNRARLKEEAIKRITIRPNLKYEQEGKENGNTDSLEPERGISRVAFIDKPSSSDVDGSETKNPGNDSPSRSYVPSDRIIATVDTSTVEGSRAAKEVFAGHNNERQHEAINHSKSSDQEVSSSLSDLTQPDQEPDKPTARGKAFGENEAPYSSADEKAVRPKTPAKLFFDRLQETITEREFGAVKRAIVDMKKYSDANERRDFILSASKVVDVILNYNSFENRRRNEKPKILGLFLTLLPKNYVADIQRCTAELLFRKSPVRKEWKECLPTELYKSLYSKIVDVIFDLWFGDDNIVEHEYVSHMDDLLKYVVNSHKPPLSSLSFLTTIIPSEQVTVTRALIDELEASLNIARLKAREKARMGENAVHVERYQRSYPIKAVDKSTDSFVENSRKAQTSKKRVIDGAAPSRDDERSGAPSLKKLLRQSGSASPYPGKQVVNVKTMNSNAPSNLTCSVCDMTTSKPYINDCGHMACLGCWTQWFERAHTCVTCRQPASPDTLALAVFKN